MADFPYPAGFHLPMLGTMSAESFSFGNCMNGVLANEAWPTANLAFVAPLRISAPYPCQTFWWNNGNVTAGNVDCGIYTQDGTCLANVGGTTQSGTSTLQVSALSTVLLLEPANYYIALALSSASGTIVTLGSPGWTGYLVMQGLAQMATAYPLPATFTFASCTSFTTSTGVPLFGISSKVSTLV